MKTLIRLGRTAAILSSPLLLGLYVYERSTGGVSAWYYGAPSTTSPTNAAQSSDTAEPGGVPVLFPGSKSYSGATVVEAGQVHGQPYELPNSAPQQAQQAEATFLPGSKSLVMPSLVPPNAPFATPSPPAWDPFADKPRDVSAVPPSPPMQAAQPNAPPSRPAIFYGTKSGAVDLTPQTPLQTASPAPPPVVYRNPAQPHLTYPGPFPGAVPTTINAPNGPGPVPNMPQQATQQGARR